MAHAEIYRRKLYVTVTDPTLMQHGCLPRPRGDDDNARASDALRGDTYAQYMDYDDQAAHHA